VPTSVPPLFGFFPAGHWKMGCPDENGGWYTFTNPERCVIIVPSINGREGGGCSA